MDRRRFIASLTAATTAVRTQHAEQKAMPVIGFLSNETSDAFAPAVAAFRKGLSDAGYVDGQNVAIEYLLGGGPLRSVARVGCRPGWPQGRGDRRGKHHCNTRGEKCNLDDPNSLRRRR